MKLRFNSYKRFSTPQEIEIRPITILIGKNNSGKSSILKLLASFLRSIDGDTAYPGLNLGSESDGFTLGPSFESICHNGNMVDLSLGMDINDNIKIDVSLFKGARNEVAFKSFRLSNKGEEVTATLDTSSGSLIFDKDKVVKEAFKGFCNTEILHRVGLKAYPRVTVDYIGPLRMVPNRMWYVNNSPSFTSGVGYDGRNAYNLVCSDDAILDSVNRWFVENMEGCHLSVDKGIEDGSFMIKVRHNEDDYGVNIADTGMGINQILPIVVSAVNKKGPDIVIVEQPELHLHPAAHAAIAGLMSEASSGSDRRFVVETHSDNFLLGIRDAIVDRDSALTPEDVIIYFIDDDNDGAYVRPITVEPDGTLSTWPAGVFGEGYELIKSIQRKASQRNDN